MRPEFTSFSSIPRLSRNCKITEKLDGTNSTVYIEELEGTTSEDALYQADGLAMHAGSRNRWITPEDDNYGFARWVVNHAAELIKLGPGWHRGEWWGSGIQRGYGLTSGDKRWSLFNTHRWCLYGTEPKINSSEFSPEVTYQEVLPECVGLVPVLYDGPFATAKIEAILTLLGAHGSYAAPGYMDPEGIVIYHEAGDKLFKKTLGSDGHKTLEEMTKKVKPVRVQSDRPKVILPEGCKVIKSKDDGMLRIFRPIGVDQMEELGCGETFEQAVEEARRNKYIE